MDDKYIQEYVEAKETQIKILFGFFLLFLVGYILFFSIWGCDNAIKKGLLKEDNIKEHCNGDGTRKASKTSGGYSSKCCEECQKTNR